jgi:hypothetical protein
LDLWLHLQVKLTKPDRLMSSTAPDVWIFCWGWGTGWVCKSNVRLVSVASFSLGYVKIWRLSGRMFC